MKILAVGGGTRGSLNKPGQHVIAAHREGNSLSKGCRAKGGGRHDHFIEYKKALKAWIEEERRNGHSLNSSDVMLQLVWTMEEMEKKLTVDETAGSLDAAQKAHLLELKVRLEKLKKKKYNDSYRTEVLKFCQVSLRKPQRQLQLTPTEEADRCRLTWQMFDRRLYDMCFGDMKALQDLVVDAAYVREHIKSAVIGFSDQVPWWGFVQVEKQLYLHSELKKSSGGPTQMRGFDNDAAAKFRVALELRQLV